MTESHATTDTTTRSLERAAAQGDPQVTAKLAAALARTESAEARRAREAVDALGDEEEVAGMLLRVLPETRETETGDACTDVQAPRVVIEVEPGARARSRALVLEWITAEADCEHDAGARPGSACPTCHAVLVGTVASDAGDWEMATDEAHARRAWLRVAERTSADRPRDWSAAGGRDSYEVWADRCADYSDVVALESVLGVDVVESEYAIERDLLRGLDVDHTATLVMIGDGACRWFARADDWDACVRAEVLEIARAQLAALSSDVERESYNELCQRVDALGNPMARGLHAALVDELESEDEARDLGRLLDLGPGQVEDLVASLSTTSVGGRPARTRAQRAALARLMASV